MRMTDPATHVIELSHKKLVFLILGGAAFALAGLWMVQLDEASIREIRTLSNPTLFRSFGVLALVLATLVVIYGTRKMFDNKPGLVLSAEGIMGSSRGRTSPASTSSRFTARRCS
jgi:protein-S-isoprenylcysteine O-methyltransferase Ste14